MSHTLGLYDGVISLSERKINHQFMMLHRRKIIKNSWCFITNRENKDKSMFGKEALKEIYSLEKLFLDKKRLTVEIRKAMDDGKAESLLELMKKQKSIDDKIKGIEYNIALQAEIDPPKIEIIQNEMNSLYFTIKFLDVPKEIQRIKKELNNKALKGRVKKTARLKELEEKEEKSYLFFFENEELMKIPLSGVEYTFKVPIGKIKVTDEATMFIENEMVDGKVKTVKRVISLKKHGIDDDDFTIESLFMNFQDARILVFDKGRSKLPEKMKSNTALQIALSNYFSSLNIQVEGEKKNTYTLGYAITSRPRQGQETRNKKWFNPKSLTFSTTHSIGKNKSAFNFLMSLDKKHTNRGVPLFNLMDKTTDKSVDSAFAIDLKYISKYYMSKISKNILKDIKERFSSISESNDVKTDDNVIKICNFTRKEKTFPILVGQRSRDYNMTLKLREPAVTTEAKKIILSYDLILEGTAKQKDDCKVSYLTFNVTSRWEFSTDTNLRKQISNNDPKNGKIHIILSVNENGNLVVEQKYESPVMSYIVTEFGIKNLKPKIIPEFIRTKFIEPLLTMASVPDFLTNLKLKNLFLIKQIKVNLDIISDNNVILPISSVYAYKNIQLLKFEDSSDKIIFFDASYKS